jgi:hypothetical protein
MPEVVAGAAYWYCAVIGIAIVIGAAYVIV